MMLRFTPNATEREREAVIAALEERGIASTATDGALQLGGTPDAEDAVAVAAMAGVAEILEDAGERSTMREAVFQWVAGAATVLGVLTVVAANMPPTIGAHADPLRTPAALRPSWPLFPWYAAVDRAPAWVPVPLLLVLAALVLFLWPHLASGFAARRPWIHAALGVATLLFVAGLAALGTLR